MNPSSTLPTQQYPLVHLTFPFSNMNPIRSLLEGILSKNRTGLKEVVQEFKKSIDEKEEPMFSKLMEITPDEPSQEAYQKAIGQLYQFFVDEFNENINAITDVAMDLDMNPQELEKELTNILLPELIKIKNEIDKTSELLLEKALNGQISGKNLEELDIIDKFLFIESNLLGIIIEDRSLEIAGKLSPYFILLMFRLLKLLQENKPLTKLLEDLKIVAKKIKEVHPTSTAIDDYFINELLE